MMRGMRIELWCLGRRRRSGGVGTSMSGGGTGVEIGGAIEMTKTEAIKGDEGRGRGLEMVTESGGIGTDTAIWRVHDLGREIGAIARGVERGEIDREAEIGASGRGVETGAGSTIDDEVTTTGRAVETGLGSQKEVVQGRLMKRGEGIGMIDEGGSRCFCA